MEDCLREVGSGAVVIGDASATVTRHDDICISSADEDVSSTDDGLCKDGGSGSVKKTKKMNPWFRAIFIMFLELFERLTFCELVSSMAK